MSTANAAQPDQPITPEAKVPESLVYERFNGHTIYYHGYKKVLAENLNPESIMGYGELQVLILNLLAEYLRETLGRSFWVLVGETGLHLALNENLSLDLVVYPRTAISLNTSRNRYLQNPPLMVLEVDTKADAEILKHMDYYHEKTQRMLDFGVEQVVWLYTSTRKVMVARPNRPWLTVNWTDEIEILERPVIIQRVLEEAEERGVRSEA